jgi:hypothetical protein
MLSLGRPLAIAFVVLALAGCSTEHRHRIIVYDQPWAAAAGPKNIWCAPELRESCNLEAKEGAAELSKRLMTAFRAAPECETVQLLIDSGSDGESKDLEEKLAKNPWGEYWRLRVDYHPELDRQPFDLSPGNAHPLDRPLVGGDDAEHNAAFICTAAKNNGVPDVVW